MGMLFRIFKCIRLNSTASFRTRFTCVYIRTSKYVLLNVLLLLVLYANAVPRETVQIIKSSNHHIIAASSVIYIAIADTSLHAYFHTYSITHATVLSVNLW